MAGICKRFMCIQSDMTTYRGIVTFPICPSSKTLKAFLVCQMSRFVIFVILVIFGFYVTNKMSVHLWITAADRQIDRSFVHSIDITVICCNERVGVAVAIKYRHKLVEVVRMHLKYTNLTKKKQMKQKVKKMPI